jgi:uncharacterized protein (TIGR02001 family)
MKKITATAIAAGLTAAVATAGVDVTMDFASAYVFRGVTFNDGPVFQPGIEASGMGLPEEYGAVAVGAWGNYDIDDYGGLLSSSEFSEVDWYASYSLPTVVEGLDLYVGYTEYTYPGAEGGADKEGNLGAGYEIAGIGLGYTAYFNVGGGAKDVYNEFTLGYGLDLSEELALGLGASAAYLAADEGDSGLHDGSLSADLSYALGEVWSVGASIAYIAQLDDEILVDETVDVDGLDGLGYDVSVVGMLSLGASF